MVALMSFLGICLFLFAIFIVVGCVLNLVDRVSGNPVHWSTPTQTSTPVTPDPSGMTQKEWIDYHEGLRQERLLAENAKRVDTVMQELEEIHEQLHQKVHSHS